VSGATLSSRRVTLSGVIERAIFEAEDRSYVVAELVARDGSRHVIAGDLGGSSIGDAIEIEGEPFVHPRFGRQLKVWSARWIPPASREGVRRLLGSGAIKGVGEKTAERIVAHFGDATLRVLDEEPERLAEVKGVTKARARAIRDAWRERRRQHEEHAFLAGLGLGPGMADRIRKALGERMPERVRANPWLLAELVDGIGFRRADDIARRLDVRSDAIERITAGVEHVLGEQSDEGHVFTPRDLLVQQAELLLGLPLGPIEDAIDSLIASGRVVAEPPGSLDPSGRRDGPAGETAIYLPRLHRAEVEVAQSLAARVGAVDARARVDAERALAWVQPRLDIELTDDQRAALARLFNERTGVLTGGPGVGKTTIVRALVEVFERKRLRVALAAPTGRAARRLADACGRPASTIHRLLEFDPRRGGFARGRDAPLELDVLIVDEASMIDLPLARDLLRALPASARWIVVGDADQLPSVGPGDVLRSLVESDRLPVARLTRILRQHEGSTIVRAAHAVLHGELPEFRGDSRGPHEGAFFVERDNPGAAQRTVVELVAERLPKAFGFDPLRSIQVLSPMNRGPLGVAELNEALKQRLNPAHGELFGPEPSRRALAESLGPGDRVIQTRNDYDLDVMNGEIGFVTARDPKSGATSVDFDDRVVDYPAASAGALQPAYAITVHKSQGCEFEAVVLVLSMQHFVLLRRNLLYTAITRARRVLVVVGAPRALRVAIEMGQVERRRSLLEVRLRAGGPSSRGGGDDATAGGEPR
jgi:exodeoxyribonuclease V alpha subunit